MPAPDAKFKSGSFSIFGDMMSQNFSLKKGTSHQIRNTYPQKMGLTFKKLVFMSRIVLLDPLPTCQFQQRKKFFIFKSFLDVSMRKEQQQPP